MGAVEERAEESAKHVEAHDKEEYVGAALGRAHRHQGGTKSPFRRHKEARKAKAQPAGTVKPRASVRSHNYHGKQGYLITGRSSGNGRYSIFTQSKAEAYRMRNDIKAGRNPEFDEYRK